MTGPRAYQLTITDGMRKRIKDLAGEGFTYIDIAKRFGISKEIVGRIVRGQR